MRMRWVLVQVLPPSRPFLGDILAVVVNRSATYNAMLNLARSMLREITQLVGDDIFPQERVFAVIDEAQVEPQIS